MDMQFGELEHAEPDVRLRPDRNKHFAVVPCGSPDPDELPIYVDIDVMRDMHRHAESDTSVELGGVLLGGQYRDDDGRAFVEVTDSLRAEHYESTKGSFKFTHETWQEITRQRDQFPAELQMVGWYHTHPDWGVFLSGMDMFICDHFFNKPLDVALVIDPCGDDRGWFQWTGEAKERIRRTGGFYLTASRFRSDELQRFADQLEGKTAMARESRYSGGESGYPAPIIHVGDRGAAWQPMAVFGMLTMQFLVIALVAWKVLTPAPATTDRIVAREADRLAAQRAVLNEVIGKLEVAPDGLIDSLADARSENESLRIEKTAQQSYLRELEEKTARLNEQRTELTSDIDRWKSSHDKLEQRTKLQTEQIAALTARINKLTGVDDDEDTSASEAETKDARLWWIGIGVAAAVALAAVVAVFSVRGKRENELEDLDSSDFQATEEIRESERTE